MTHITITDIDGSSHHTIDRGEVSAVRNRFPADHPVQAIITDAMESGGQAKDTYQLDGEEYTTSVSIA